MTKLQRKLFFFTLFSITGFIFLQIPFSQLIGSNVNFTLFDFFAPMAGAFLGPFYGVASVLGVLVINNLIGDVSWTTGVIIRLFPTLFAVYYFATITSKKYNPKWILAVPVLAILAFLAHPEGRQVAYYTLFWVIPLIAYRFKNNLVMKSLGTTFTAHAAGGAAWIWAFNLPASVWNALIPVVISERILFALGIAASFVVVKHTLNFLAAKKLLPKLDPVSN